MNLSFRVIFTDSEYIYLGCGVLGSLSCRGRKAVAVHGVVSWCHDLLSRGVLCIIVSRSVRETSLVTTCLLGVRPSCASLLPVGGGNVHPIR